MQETEAELRVELSRVLGSSARVLGGSLNRLPSATLVLIRGRFLNVRSKGVDAPRAFTACPELFETETVDVDRRWDDIEGEGLDANAIVAIRPDVLTNDDVAQGIAARLDSLELDGIGLLRARPDFIAADFEVLTNNVDEFLVHELDVRTMVEADPRFLECNTEKLADGLEALHDRRDWPTVQAELNAGNTKVLRTVLAASRGLLP